MKTPKVMVGGVIILQLSQLNLLYICPLAEVVTV